MQYMPELINQLRAVVSGETQIEVFIKWFYIFNDSLGELNDITEAQRDIIGDINQDLAFYNSDPESRRNEPNLIDGNELIVRLSGYLNQLERS